MLADFLPQEQAALLALKQKVNHAFVTGAGGFLGKAICERLLAAGIKVTGFARGQYSELSAMGVEMVKGDIADEQALLDAMQGCDVVFHVASKAGVWGSKQSYFSPNIDGARHIIAACKKCSIERLVYTSTPSVTFAGVDEVGNDESAPYAKQFLNFYGESKAIAEQMMLSANGDKLSNGKSLGTTALRPHLIWGPSDPHLVPRVLERAEAGRLKLVGREDKLVDTIYVGNAAYAHVLAALKLCCEDASRAACAGKAYYLSNDEPITMAAMLNKILACKNRPPVTKRVPSNLAYVAGCILESIYSVLGKQDEPIMTRFVARQLSTSHYFDISAAKRDLDYQALVSIDEGMERLKASLQ
ncbi:NAD-dependent epimerase/dehydratase family protein [Shewanella schlegeliana]|uniref:NAD-dependent epimerase/dehydratase family protein n=1 Tax=Shewanella schlegeliana TaxID=190308 RepID=A0ABS1SXL5_9GAMM|nr:2-alkyl-3-oxoalkanoate reductase [Shewanella schlegeliana]MBL4913291.1 NAD-dependent epimerase/dehydratase family protein [Shewanella schlegeliana]MCL1109246.1 NAD-dependent epimerase/dehydratase family protein [Shewanella schlegeliana]